MWQHNMNYMKPVDHLRSMPAENPECRQHTDQIAQCMADAFSANNRVYDVQLGALRHTVKLHEERIARLEHLLMLAQKQNLTTPGAAGVFAAPAHLSDLEKNPQQPLN